MPGWDGSGNFVMPYSMVAEKMAGVKILASHQDTQWTAVAGGLENCMTLDSQTKPTADVDINSHKLINVSSPTGANDGANKSYVDAVAANQWILEQASVVWVDATHFKIPGVDKTAIYSQSRRLKIVHNNGATTSYGTVGLATFSTDTTVHVTMDQGTALVSPITALSYSVLEYMNPPYLDPRSIVSVSLSAPQNIAAITATKLLFDTETIDLQGEFDSVTNHRFAPFHGGYYFCNINVVVQQTSAGILNVTLGFYKNGTVLWDAQTTTANNAGLTITGFSFTKAILLVQGDYLEAFLTMTIAGQALPGLGGSGFEIMRIA